MLELQRRVYTATTGVYTLQLQNYCDVCTLQLQAYIHCNYRTSATYIHCNSKRYINILQLQAAAGASTNRSTGSRSGLSPRAAAFEPKDEEEAKVYEELKELFQFYDTDGSGELGIAEVRALFVYFFFKFFLTKEKGWLQGARRLGGSHRFLVFCFKFFWSLASKRLLPFSCIFCCFIAFLGARFVSQG
jgi:hypothetical protein